MVFSSTVFIFLFLPLVLGLYFVVPKALKNSFLLLVSLGFYAWGEHVLVLLMVGSILLNYAFGRLIVCAQQSKSVASSKWVLALGVGLNLTLLGYYKYIGFILENLRTVGIDLSVDLTGIHLPIGISFFTFQGLSYLVDVYNRSIKSQKNVIDLGMYIALFPQLVAGPIVRYIDIENQIRSRIITLVGFSKGVERFIIGFAKKVLIANNMGLVADQVFGLQAHEISTPLAWIGVVCYAFQIFYDFSGYSDMAIGLGSMFGFTFKENFNYPYSSLSIKEFWRKWHISLSTWFRDYVYIPLGGNRLGAGRMYLNLIIVFFLTGLWHGASWHFIVWGLFHGFFLIAERKIRIPDFSGKTILAWVYTVLVVLIGWVFFRADNLTDAWAYLNQMFVYQSIGNPYPHLFLDSYRYLIFAFALVFSFPVYSWFSKGVKAASALLKGVKYTGLLLLFLLAVMEMAQSTYNPFIYFRF